MMPMYLTYLLRFSRPKHFHSFSFPFGIFLFFQSAEQEIKQQKGGLNILDIL